MPVYQGNNLDLLARIPDGAIHAVVSDPPYGLSFMGRAWDRALPDPATWRELYRVLPPGGHMVLCAAPRLYHRLACDVEDAGFEVRDCLVWLNGQGFPKSLDVSKAIDKAAGAERDVIGVAGRSGAGRMDGWGFLTKWHTTAPATTAAAQWAGWGTALRPGYEPIGLFRKPINGTIARTVETYGTGALNIDACRLAGADTRRTNGSIGYGGGGNGAGTVGGSDQGRWPPNVILDEHAAAHVGFEARYFYCPKASKREREAGLEGLPPHVVDPTRAAGSAGRDNPRAGAGRAGGGRRNHHPTVKPLALMRWLLRMVTPPGGVALDPFVGSGTTLAAAALEGIACVGMEIDPDYVAIARAREAYWRNQRTASQI